MLTLNFPKVPMETFLYYFWKVVAMGNLIALAANQ